MSLWQKPQKLFKAVQPNLKEFIGKSVVIQDVAMLEGKRTVLSEKRVWITHICGNRFKQNFYEINGQHLISMLRFHAQMEGDRSITEDQFIQFEEMEITAEKLPETELLDGKNKLLDSTIKEEKKNGETRN